MLDKLKGNASASKETDSIDFILNEDEEIINSFKIWRDEFVVTTSGLYYLDKQGFKGKKIFTKFFPGKYIEGFSFENAGKFDRNSEITIYVKTNFVSGENTQKISFQVRKKDTDLVYELLKEIKKNFF